MPTGVYPRSEEQKAKLRGLFKGKHHTDEAKAKDSAANKGNKNPFFGKQHTKEVKARLSVLHTGKHLTKQAKAKVSAATKKRWGNPKFRASQSIIRKKQWKNLEYRARMTAINTARSQTPEFRAKRSLVLKKLWQDPNFAKKVFTNRQPNKVELQLQDFLDRHFPSQWKYVGNKGVRLGKLYPDFININGKKEVIELFGAHWHPLFDVAQKKEHYRQYGFRVAIIWEDELKDEARLMKVFRNKF